jgi:hypothetical protein
MVDPGDKGKVLDSCIDTWLEGVIRPWTRDTVMRHLEIAFSARAVAAQAWLWAQRRAATIMVDALAPQQFPHNPDGRLIETDFPTGPEPTRNNEWYQHLVKAWLEQAWQGRHILPSLPEKKGGESNRTYMKRTRQARDKKSKAVEQAINQPSESKKSIFKSAGLSKEDLLNIMTVTAARFARAVENGVDDVQPHLSKLFRSKRKKGGRPRQDELARKASDLHESGQSWRQVANQLNRNTGITRSIGAYRKLVGQRQKNQPT